jgi:predicted GNAT family acetyltransferase
MEIEVIEDQLQQIFGAIASDGEYKGAHIGEMRYIDRASFLEVWHTEISPDFEGMGLASKLAKQTLELIKQTNRKVYVRCPYLEGWIEKHPEYKELVYE